MCLLSDYYLLPITYYLLPITYYLLPKNIAVILSDATNIAVIAVIITATGATWWLLFDTAAVRMLFLFSQSCDN